MKYSTNRDGFLATKPKVVVVTPTVNPLVLGEKCASSVLEQRTEFNLDHLFVEDGIDCIKLAKMPNQHFLHLPWNIGANGWYGHRVYASIAHLVDHDYVLFLDQDNWFEKDHVQSLVDMMEFKPYLQFGFSHRKIYDPSGDFVAIDRFESIGTEPHWLVDTSSYIFRRQSLLQFGHLWHGKWGADRRFFQIMKQNNIPYSTTGLPTLCYQLDGNPNSPKREFFEYGNEQTGWTKDGTKRA